MKAGTGLRIARLRGADPTNAPMSKARGGHERERVLVTGWKASAPRRYGRYGCRRASPASGAETVAPPSQIERSPLPLGVYAT